MPVTVYTRPSCAPCKTLKYWLNKKNVAFIEIDVDSDPQLINKVIQLSGYGVVPLTIIQDQAISGLNLPMISKILML